jgi:starvation-inducible DNA-binding protein
MFAMSDPIAERASRVGGQTLHSIGHIARMQRLLDNDVEYEPSDMLADLHNDRKALASSLRDVNGLSIEYRDIAIDNLIEVWIDETERRTWFLFQATRRSGNSRA